MAEQERNTQQQRPSQGPGGFGGGPPMMRGGGEKAKDFKGTLKKLVAYLAPYKWSILVVSIFAAVSAVAMTFGPKIMAKATDALVSGLKDIILGVTDKMDFTYIGQILLITLAIYVGSTLISYVQGMIIAKVSTSISYDMRNSLIQKINRLPIDYFHRTAQGDIMSRVTNDVDSVSSNLNQTITQAVSSVASLISTIVMMLTISGTMTLISLAVIPISAIAIVLIMKNSQKFFKRQQKALGRVNGHIEEMYGSHTVVKVFNGEQKSIDDFNEGNEELYHAAWRAQFYSSLIMPLTQLIGNIGYVIVCMIGASMAAGGKLTLGGIQAFISYMRTLNQSITQVGGISTQFQMTIAAAERVFEFMDEKELEVVEPKVRIARNGESGLTIRGDVVFDHVRFSYNGEDIIIKDFSADVKAGQKVAIVGPTGAGKTTLVKLLMRFYDVDSGSISIDGNNITDFSRHDLRSQIGMVLQDTWLFNGTILENIRYGRPDASDEEVIAAAKAAQVDKFVRMLDDGYQFELNEESTNISQGQKQLITIARAILAETNILILDEATSSVDTRTEIMIQRAMDNLMQNHTSFIIAHRLSTIRNADLILCLNEGDIVEQGTHEELLAKGGFYAELYRSQFESMSA